MRPIALSWSSQVGRRKPAVTLSPSFCYCLLLFIAPIDSFTTESVSNWSKELSTKLQNMFESATNYQHIDTSFREVADAEVFDPQTEVRTVKRRIENYLRERAKMAWGAKVSLESKEIEVVDNLAELNDPMSKNFVRYLNAKTQDDAVVVYKDGHFGERIEVNATRDYAFEPNANFYDILTNSEASAVHVPTPIYNRNPYLLERIAWSNIDQVYRRNRERLKDLSFQKFCSESGFMRYFPAAPWIFDSREDKLDLFDCRSSEWFIDAATMSKNVLIMLDLSGSMLGQRLEIAKQTVQSILDTLSDNDFFNIMAFSKNIELLDICTDEGLVQATMRNKQRLLAKMSNISSEGKAEYEKALVKSFSMLMDLPGAVFWRTKEELDREQNDGLLDPKLKYIQLEDNVLVVSEDYVNAIRKVTGNKKQMGCNDVIMLITDGAPGFYKEVFDLYNKEKRIRFFSFLVGEEATDFEQVRWMSCNNRGFMVHINNLADVREKVQHYVKVMSRSISRQNAAIHQEDAIWSGTGRERTSNEFVISVSYPVVLDGNFTGVSAVSIPLTELAQIANPVIAGGESYFFMLDNNGYAMFHPQLRPVDAITGDVKATFSNMDFVEIDFQTLNPPKVDLSCTNSELKGLISLFSVDNMRRVYRVKSDYYAECIDGTYFTVGLSLTEGDNARLKRANSLFSFTQVDMNWFKEHNWRLHPKWRYCLLNDSDTDITREEAFEMYARQMRDTGKLPTLCHSRRQLIERVLLDLDATTGLSEKWNLVSDENKRNGIHLAFFASPSGVIRYVNRTLDGLYYERADGDAEQFAYRHFVLQLNARTTDSDYFKRAVRQKGRIVFDINRKTRLWNGPDAEKTPYGNFDNETILGNAFKALYIKDALVGVVGMEFNYDTLVEYMKEIGCLPEDDRMRCYLLDEHGYVVYTSQRDTYYSDYIRAFSEEMSHEVPIAVGNLAVAQRTHHQHQVQHHTSWSQHRQQHRPILTHKKPVHQQHATQSPIQDFVGAGVDGNVVLGHFFGHINRVTEWTMELLIKKGFYKKTVFVDNQGMCDPDIPVQATTAGVASVFSQPLKSAVRLIFWVLTNFVLLLQRLTLLHIDESRAQAAPTPTPASDSGTAPPPEGRFSCRKKSPFYLADPDYRTGSAALLEENMAERPCMDNAAQCALKVYASWIESTNLLLVVVRQGSRSNCYDTAHCAIQSPPAIPFGFQRMVGSGTDYASEETVDGSNADYVDPTVDQSQPVQLPREDSCASVVTHRKRKNVVQCLRDDFLEDESTMPCSGATRSDFALAGLLIGYTAKAIFAILSYNPGLLPVLFRIQT